MMLSSGILEPAFWPPLGSVMIPSTVLMSAKSYSSKTTWRPRSRSTMARTSGTFQFMTVFFAVPANSLSKSVNAEPSSS